MSTDNELDFGEKVTEDRRVVDPVNYMQLAAGYETREEADKAVNDFWNEFYELRNKYRIADVLVAARIIVQGAGDCMLSMHAGSDFIAESLAAFAYGKASSDRQEAIMKMMESAARSIRKPSNKR